LLSPGFKVISVGSRKNAVFEGSNSLRKQNNASTSIGDVLSIVKFSTLDGYIPARILQTN
jgi:hypothetical protein